MPEEKKKGLSQAEEKLFDALNDSYDALLEAIRAGTERGYRVSKELMEQAQRAQRESMELGKKLVDAPTDLAGFYGALVEATSKAQGRTLELAREWLGELGDAGKEARDALQHVVKANQAAARAAAEAARSGFGRAREAAVDVMPRGRAAGGVGSDNTRPSPAEGSPPTPRETSTTE